jgi:hypothetical protein
MRKKKNHIPDPLAHHCWLLLTVSRQLSEERRQQYRPSSSLACDEFFFSKGGLAVVSLREGLKRWGNGEESDEELFFVMKHDN